MCQARAATACRVEHRRNERERSTDQPDVQEHTQAQHAKQTVEQPDRGKREAPDRRSQPVPDQSEANRTASVGHGTSPTGEAYKYAVASPCRKCG